MSGRYDIKAIYRQLEEDLTERRAEYLAAGQLVVRELYTEQHVPFFLAVEPVEMKRLVILPQAGIVTKLELRRLPDCRGIKPGNHRFEQLGSLEEQQSLFIRQTTSEAAIFEAFAEHLCHRVAKGRQSELLPIIKQTMQQWQDFFRKGTSAGLTQEERRGLFGELTVLLALLNQGLTPDIVECWKGPKRAVIDFRFGPAGLEVKTSLDLGSPSATISSEHQLASGAADPLYLAVILLERVGQEGQTLCDLVQTVRARMEGWPLSLDDFSGLLLEYGYSDIHAEAYRDERYRVAEQRHYHVRDGFPRIGPDQLMRGVANVRYEIQLDLCSSFQLHADEVYRGVKGALTDGP